MDLQIKNSLFIVTGASSGFGRKVALTLLQEGARVILNARRMDMLLEMQSWYPDQVEIVAGDITSEDTIGQVMTRLGDKYLAGVLVNAGGPPAGSFLETPVDEWDQAYLSVMRWKMVLINKLLPVFRKQAYGRIVLIESLSVKQPVENLVLSNAFRPAVVGFAKTLALEVARENITVNVLAPGYHDTAAIERVIIKQSNITGLPYEVVKEKMEQSVPVGFLGDPEQLASLGCWLLSPLSSYVTGQTISVDGGLVKGIFG